MILEIMNPSDACTIESDDIVVAGLAIALISNGQYALDNEKGETVVPIFFLGGFKDWLKEHNVSDVDKYIDEKHTKMADVLASIVYGGFTDRQLFNLATKDMPPDKLLEYRKEWNDKKRSSLNDISTVCLRYADKLRGLVNAKAT